MPSIADTIKIVHFGKKFDNSACGKMLPMNQKTEDKSSVTCPQCKKALSRMEYFDGGVKKESKSYFRSLARLLREAEKDEEKEKGEDSLDAQIDNYLASYESEAKLLKKEGRDYRSLVRRFLTEAGDDEEEEKDDEEDKKEDEDAEEEKGDEEKDEGGEDEEKEEPKKLSLEDIDPGSFADSVVRLIENYENLLEVRNTILRRASNFLAKTYEKDVIDSFKESLAERHGIELNKSSFEKEEEYVAPNAARAGSSPGGGA